MKFATLPFWHNERALVAVDAPHTLAFPMPGISGIGVTGALTPVPLELTLAKCVEYWWRVQTWRVEATIASGPYNLTCDITSPIVAGAENQLCRPQKWPGLLDFSGGGVWFGETDYGTYDGAERLLVKDFRPRLTLMPMEYGDYPVDPPYTLPPSSNPPATRPIFPVLIFTIEGTWEYDGAEGALNATTTTGGVGDTISATIDAQGVTLQVGTLFTILSCTVTPILWRAYADQDGNNPTWDTATGERI